MAKKFYRFINSKDKNDFLNYYIQCGTISKAAKKAGITRQTHYNWLKDDKKGFYRRAFELADKMAADLLEEEAFRRAVEGDLQVVYYKGEEVGPLSFVVDPDPLDRALHLHVPVHPYQRE